MKTTITVELSTLDKNQLLRLPVSLLVDEILELRETIQELQEPSTDNASPDAEGAVTEEAGSIDGEDFIMPTTPLTFDLGGVGRYKASRNPRSDVHVGMKTGSTSKYHYVSYNRSTNKWVVQVWVPGAKGFHKRFKNEIDSAVAVDVFLDKVGDPKRPRNYDEFQEVKVRHERGN